MSVYKCYDCNTVLCKDCSRKHNDEYKNQSHSMQPISDSFILNCKFHLMVAFISDIQCLPNGEVFVACLSDVRTFSVSGIQRRAIQLEDCARLVSVVDSNTVAVLLKNNHIALVDIQQNHVQYISIIGTPYSSGTFTYIENEFYISDKHCIMVIDMSGSVKRRITLSFTPDDMCYDVDSQRIYCIGSKHGQLLCIERNGNDLFTFTNPGMTNLRSITIDKEGNVLVLRRNEDDISRYCVIKVDFKGNKSEVVITNINTLRFDSPHFFYEHLTDSVVIVSDYEVYIYKKR